MVKLAKSGWFLGEYHYRLDDKYRLALPKRLRVEIEGFEVVLTKGFERYIAGFDMKRFEIMAAQPLAIPGYDTQGRQLRRQVFAQASILEVDTQGRIVLPEALVSWAKLSESIGKEVVIIGAGDHFEIWEAEQWKAMKSE